MDIKKQIIYVETNLSCVCGMRFFYHFLVFIVLFLILLLSMYLFSYSPAPSSPVKDKDQVVDFKLAGLTRTYTVHLPPSYRDTPLPVVLVLHGAGGSAKRAAHNYGWIQKADKESFIAVFPQAVPLHKDQEENAKTNPTLWNDGSKRADKSVDDIAYLRHVIKDVSLRYLVDPKRIFMTGFSSGASMTFRAGIDLSDILAAIAPVAGHLWLENPKPIRPMSLMLIAGDSDPLNPLNGGLANNLWSKTQSIKPPMDASIKKWLPLIGVDESQKSITGHPPITIVRYGPNRIGGDVVIFIVVHNQGHEWPGGRRSLPKRLTGNNTHAFSATDTIWNFFSSQSL